MKMKQRMISMVLTVCLAAWLFPMNVLAADSVTWGEILNQIGNGSQEVNDPSNPWRFYSTASGGSVIHIEAGTTVSGDGTIRYDVNNYGTIDGGTFSQMVENAGTISSGTFNGLVRNKGTGIISEGTFKGYVLNEGTISGGDFKDTVDNDGGNIYAGTFQISPTYNPNNPGTIYYNNITIINPSTSLPGQGPSEDRENEGGGHTHSCTWVITVEPTETTDGLWEYRCECGHVEGKQPVSLYTVVIRNIINDIQNAPENGTVTIDHATLRCLSDEIVAVLLTRPDVTVHIDFTDRDVAYSLTIPAGQAPTDGQEWYGYYYLGFVYGWTSIENLAAS